MRARLAPSMIATLAVLWLWAHGAPMRAASEADRDAFRTSDRCQACHNELKTRGGEDISIGHQWSASVMANAGRDPYWQASVRRETVDHPDSSLDIQDECSTCHMPMQHLMDRAAKEKTQVFARLPLQTMSKGFTPAADGVSCSVCHQVEAAGLGTQATFSGNVNVASPQDRNNRPEYGPFDVDAAHQKVMQSSTAGFVPTAAGHIRDSALCGSCHTLYTTARGAAGKAVGRLPEQMPYLEWKHSGYYNRQSCQDCHMPQVEEATRVSSVYGPLRDGMHRHVFVGGNILLERILNEHRGELDVQALPDELAEAEKRTTEFLETRSARVRIEGLQSEGDGLAFAVKVENLTGHKLPTAYPSRRAWLHVVVRDAGGKVVFESGALRADGSIAGNDNDADPLRYEPHYAEITRPDQVEIFESILKDERGNVTTGLISAVGYLKDNRVLPDGFDKRTAEGDIAVIGGAAADPQFTGGASSTRYRVSTRDAQGPFQVEAELWYQPVGYRWAHNLAAYQTAETQRWVRYFDENSSATAVVLGRDDSER